MLSVEASKEKLSVDSKALYPHQSYLSCPLVRQRVYSDRERCRSIHVCRFRSLESRPRVLL
jgi:hypothetical protein